MLIVGLIVLGISFSFNPLKINAQELEDKCEGLVSKAAQTYKECFGGDIVIEFTPKLVEAFGITSLEDEWAMLDGLSSEFKNRNQAQIFIIIYGGKVNKKGEMKERADRLVDYLTENRKIDLEKISVINGGFKERFEFELWFSPSKNIFPPLSPTVNVETVIFKGKMKPLERELGN